MQELLQTSAIAADAWVMKLYLKRLKF